MKKMFYVHIPKCGGTSIKKAILNGYKGRPVFNLDPHASKLVADEFCEEESLFSLRNKLVLYALTSNKYWFVGGHTVLTESVVNHCKINKTDYKFVTLLRDPVERYLSHFFFNQNKSSKHYKINDDFSEFLKTKHAKEFGKYYVRYFSGLNNTSVEKAIDNLKYFDVIGFLDDIPTFEKNILEHTGLELSISQENENPLGKDYTSLVSDNDMKLVLEFCKGDIEVYEYAKALI
jgi:hypothetical protein